MRFYEEWKDTPIHILNRVYLFNFTNPKDFEMNGTKPMVKELGPYTFKEYQKKTNITWNSNSTVTYRVHRIWYFEPGMSNGTLDDNITTVNLLPLMAARILKDQSYLIQRGTSIGLTSAGEKFAVTKTVNEFTFKGYDYFYSFIGTYFRPTIKKIGFFHTFNDSSLRDGLLNVDTGEFDIKQNGKVKFWNYSPYQFPAGLITGTTGELFSLDLEKSNITIFSPWICRDMIFDYIGEEYVNGVRGYKFVPSDQNFDNGSKYKENLMSWPEKRFPFGIVNASQCYYDGTLIASCPHFYMADPYFANQVEGMRPEPEKHQSYYIVEPVTGVPLKARVFGQANVLVSQNKNFRVYKNIPTHSIIPVLSVEKSFTIPNTILEYLRAYLYLVSILEMSAIPSVIIGICIVSFTVVWNIDTRYRTILCYRITSLRRRKTSEENSRNLEMDKKYHFKKLPQNFRITDDNIKINTTE